MCICVRACVRVSVCGDFACVHACVSARACLRSCAHVRVRIEVRAYVDACGYVHESKTNRKSRIAPVTVKSAPHMEFYNSPCYIDRRDYYLDMR